MTNPPLQPSTTGNSPDPDPAATFTSLADMLYAQPDFAAVYQAVCDAAPILVPGCDHASLMLRVGDRFETAAASSDIARAIDEIEREIGEGPCVDAIVDEAAQIDSDLTDGSPWPRLAARILAETPVRGTAGFRLVVHNRKVGALNLFAERSGALSADAVGQAAVLAAFASVALMAVDRNQAAETLRAGLESNREVGKAIGLLMAFHKISDEEAFAMLRTASQDMNLKMSAVAREVIDHHHSR